MLCLVLNQPDDKRFEHPSPCICASSKSVGRVHTLPGQTQIQKRPSKVAACVRSGEAALSPTIDGSDDQSPHNQSPHVQSPQSPQLPHDQSPHDQSLHDHAHQFKSHPLADLMSHPLVWTAEDLDMEAEECLEPAYLQGLSSGTLSLDTCYDEASGDTYAAARATASIMQLPEQQARQVNFWYLLIMCATLAPAGSSQMSAASVIASW